VKARLVGIIMNAIILVATPKCPLSMAYFIIEQLVTAEIILWMLEGNIT